MSFDPCDRFLRIWKSTETPTPKVEALLEVWGFIPSHFLTLSGACGVIPRLPSWPTTLQALALVVSPRLKLWQFVFEGDSIEHVQTFKCLKILLKTTSNLNSAVEC
jgi:hypothetical protein